MTTTTPRARKGSREGDTHRSLYAKPDTFKLIRKLAVEEYTASSSLFREALLLMLQRRGYFKGARAEDL